MKIRKGTLVALFLFVGYFTKEIGSWSGVVFTAAAFVVGTVVNYFTKEEYVDVL